MNTKYLPPLCPVPENTMSLGASISGLEPAAVLAPAQDCPL